jgi:hypothetical protein
MRGISLLLLGASLVSCTTAPEPTRSAKHEQQYQDLINGKVAGAAQGCLPLLPNRGNDMVVIDDQTIAFKAGAGRVYVNHLGPGCTGVGLGNALVTKQTGSSLCRGDIAQVQNLTSGITIGSCTLGDFVPYARAGG